MKGEINPLIHMCQIMEHLGPKANNNNINPYVTKYKKVYEEHHLLLAEQDSIGWDNFLCGKFSKQWRIYQTFYKDQRKLANCVTWSPITVAARDLANHGASVSTADEQIDASTKRKKKRKANVFQHIISTIFDVAETMWNH